VRAAFTNVAIGHHGGGALQVAGPGCVVLADMLFIDNVDLGGQGAAAVSAVGGAFVRIGAQRHIVVRTGPETEGDVRLG
jgi:hypothetical protein